MLALLISILTIYSIWTWVHNASNISQPSYSSLNKRDSIILKGQNAERKLVKDLIEVGIPEKAIFHNLHIPKSNGAYSQVDAIALTSRGLIVIEAKNYSGLIFGNGNHTNWTQVLAYGNKKKYFYNPIKQNKNHIKTIQKYTKNLKNLPFYSIVVFYGNCELKQIDYIPKKTYITKASRLPEVLNEIRETNPQVNYRLTKKLINFLQNSKENSKNNLIREKHVKHINDITGKTRVFN